MKIRHTDLLPYMTNSYETAVNSYIPRVVTVSLSQDSSGTTICMVKAGDRVTEGQVIATGTSLRGTVIHSPVPGIVEGFTSCTMPDGKRSPAVRIKVQGEFSLFGKPVQNCDWKSFSPASLRRSISDNGIINTFGKPVPLGASLDELTSNSRKPVIIVRLFDEDPSCAADSFITETYISQVLTGAMIIASAVESERILLVYKKTKEGVPAFSIPDENTGKITFSLLPVDGNRYPSGGMREIIRSVPKKNHPIPELSIQDLFTDSRTAFAVHEAVVHSQPALDTYVHVAGRALPGSGIFKVRVGTPIKNLAAECGGFISPPAKIIINGFLYGTNISELSIPVTKYVKSVFFVPGSDVSNQTPFSCIRCGKCRSICPSGILPDMLYAHYAVRRNIDPEYLKTAYICSGCMLCNTVCPARLPLQQVIDILKGSLDET